MGKAKAATAAASARQEVTLALSQPLPALLRKFQTEPRKVIAKTVPSDARNVKQHISSAAA